MEHQIPEAVGAALDAAKDAGYKIPVELGIRFDLRGRAAGMFCWRGAEQFLRFNMDIAYNNAEHFLAQTVPHEVAHAVVRCNWPSAKGHGAEWKEIMAVLGVPATRCHSYACEPSRKVQRHSYKCACKAWELTTNRHHKVLFKGQVYTCRNCHTALEMT